MVAVALSRIFLSVRGSSTRTWLNPLCSHRVDSWRRLFKRRAHKDAPPLFVPRSGKQWYCYGQQQQCQTMEEHHKLDVKLDSSEYASLSICKIVQWMNRFSLSNSYAAIHSSSISRFDEPSFPSGKLYRLEEEENCRRRELRGQKSRKFRQYAIGITREKERRG